MRTSVVPIDACIFTLKIIIRYMNMIVRVCVNLMSHLALFEDQPHRLT